MEAQYVALSEAVQEIVWWPRWWGRLLDAKQNKTSMIYEDNKSCLEFGVLDPSIPLNDIAAPENYMQQTSSSCCISHRKEMIADALTKPFSLVKLKKLATRYLGLIPLGGVLA